VSVGLFDITRRLTTNEERDWEAARRSVSAKLRALRFLREFRPDICLPPLALRLMSELHPREVDQNSDLPSVILDLNRKNSRLREFLRSPLASCESTNSLDNDDSDTGLLFQER
jgi:hypothetical protein